MPKMSFAVLGGVWARSSKAKIRAKTVSGTSSYLRLFLSSAIFLHSFHSLISRRDFCYVTLKTPAAKSREMTPQICR